MTRRDALRLSLAASFPAGSHPPLAWANEPAKRKTPDEMIDAYLAAEVKRISAKFMDGAKTKDEWAAARPRLKREFLDMLGLDPLPDRTPLKATVTGTLERGNVTIENVHFQSRPGLYVTGNLYRPKGAGDKKHPGIVYVCGHSNRGRDGNKTAFQDHGLWFASNGYVCLVVDTLQLGEVAGKHHGTYNLGRWWWHDRGYTPAGVECWNGVRAIDYLVSRPEVDADKIGVTGISGGGATTCWVAAADDRVKVAVPVSGMSDLECYVADKVINGHCDCMFPLNTYQWNLQTVLALFAPKPLLFANSDADPIFPMAGNRRIAERMRVCYELLGAKDKFDDYVSKGGHDYRPDLRTAVFKFFHTHLLGSDAAVKDADCPKIDGKDLRVFPTDADLPKDAINATADESFVPTATVKLPADAKDFAAWKTDTLKQLRERCFRALPEKVRSAKRDQSKDDKTHHEWTAELGLPFPGRAGLLGENAPNGRSKFQYTLVVLNPEDDLGRVKNNLPERVFEDSTWASAVLPRGGGPNRWTRKNPPNTIERSLALLGQTADGGRVHDVAAMLTYLIGRDWGGYSGPHVTHRLVGSGPAGVIAAYAVMLAGQAGFAGTITELIVIDPPVSHRDGPHLLNVLRVLDVPEALGLLAPQVKLTLLGKTAKDKAFDRTAALYAAAGAADKFVRE
ncbi:acetyl xylan esterase : Acetyl xylan esterase OS=Isosphaera pallida (strain ATCC 43644 / DSM 9630 / IS1B) GN=Isop_1803 PE=4 SV=1: Peptidase_S9 [Gemmataceae bacterium]|nr:acetyl xylan esterase : Acetyl xylan esterase OS=Isosphaera pallida (strain ATCC 43644 / DSM 9630 / IS1B) GN=Isop_1803 PE=4 SV=1: Peptidase_S9 [Gemmataceae bacterium]VTU00650.1 acetyl xylan esterase : Acetyl xylan esterase OS=Isosphaera pallida (strain ATCC 43644 / DSM 9630 / IS1B) GN=Isop_1803 PE=4 SV=1: Peptidase_S9 [Gemmataceae bacterium]